MDNDVDRREFNFEFDPDKVYLPTSGLRHDSRSGGYENVSYARIVRSGMSCWQKRRGKYRKN